MKEFAKTNKYRLNHVVNNLQSAVETAIIMRHEFDTASYKQKEDDVGDYTEENMLRYFKSCREEIKGILEMADMYLNSLDEEGEE